MEAEAVIAMEAEAVRSRRRRPAAAMASLRWRRRGPLRRQAAEDARRRRRRRHGEAAAAAAAGIWRRRRPRRQPLHSSRDAGRNWRDRELGGARGGAALAPHPRHGGGQGELPVLLQDRRAPPRRPVLAPAPQAALLANDDRAAVYRTRRRIAAAGGDPSQLDPKKVQEEFDEFYEEVYDELAGYGEIEELNACENLGDHMQAAPTKVRRRGARRTRRSSALRPLLRGPAARLRVLARDGLPRGALPPVRRGVCHARPLRNFMHIRTVAVAPAGPRERCRKWRKAREKRERQEPASCSRRSSATTARLAPAPPRVARRSRDKGKEKDRRARRSRDKEKAEKQPRLPPRDARNAYRQP